MNHSRRRDERPPFGGGKRARSSAFGGNLNNSRRDLGIRATESRRSSLFGKAPQKKRDLRDLKRDLSKNAEEILRYAQEHGCASPDLTKKMLLKPSSGFVKLISLFLFQQTDASYTEFQRFEEDFADFFLLMGYPFTITQSYLKSAASPYAWPMILGALSWLVQLLNYGENVEEEEFDEEEQPHDHVELAYDEYNKFIASGTTYEELNDRLAAHFDSNKSGIQRDIDELSAAQTEMQADIARWQCPENSVSHKKMDLSIKQNEHDQFKHLIHESENENLQISEQLSDHKEELKRVVHDMEQENVSHELLSKQLEEQDISPKDVKAFNRDVSVCKASLDSLEEEGTKINQALGERQAKLDEMRQLLDRHVAEYNRLLEAIELAPRSARYAYDTDYKAKVDPDIEFDLSENDDKIFAQMTNLDPSFLDILSKLERQLNEALGKNQEKLRKYKEKKAELEETIKSVQRQFGAQNERLIRFKEAEKKKKDAWQKNMHKKLAEIDQVELEVYDMNGGGDQIEKLQVESKSTRDRLEAMKANWEKEQQRVATEVTQILNKVDAHRLSVKNALDEIDNQNRETQRILDEEDKAV